MFLKKVISGGQNGVDVAGLKAAKDMGIPTGGSIPNGFKTLDGPKPEYAVLYDLTEHSSSSYPPRTYQNARDADGTIRIAHDFNSSGEICTLKAINQYKKPYFDVIVKNTQSFTTPEEMSPKKAADWIKSNNIKILNVAGNSEKTSPGIEFFAHKYLVSLFKELANS